MVLIDLCKLYEFGTIVSQTPADVSKRKSRLIECFNSIEPEGSLAVSVKIKADLERIVERDIELEVPERRLKIIEFLIDHFSNKQLDVKTMSGGKTFLMPPVIMCLFPECQSEELMLCRPNKTENCVPIFTQGGVIKGEVYRKRCRGCNAEYYYSYVEYKSTTGQLMRSYYSRNMNPGQYFSFTNATFFEKELLNVLAEEIVTCNVQFTNWTECYNRLKTADSERLSVKLLVPAWLVFQAWMRCDVNFPVVRDKAGNLDVETVCSYILPSVRRYVDLKWITHCCSKCDTRLVVLDGNAKLYRTVCAFESEKLVSRGSLNTFNECSNNPLPGKSKCGLHDMQESSNDADERVDLCRVTRSMRKELGLDVETLTSEMGCRKKENIHQRQERNKTAGMIYAYRYLV